MSSRRYIKRVWRVPKDRGALECFATLLVKMLRKHGWPARWVRDYNYVLADALLIREWETPDEQEIPEDFREAVRIAAAILARTYKIEIEQAGSWVALARPYAVTPRGTFKEIKE